MTVNLTRISQLYAGAKGGEIGGLLSTSLIRLDVWLDEG